MHLETPFIKLELARTMLTFGLSGKDDFELQIYFQKLFVHCFANRYLGMNFEKRIRLNGSCSFFRFRYCFSEIGCFNKYFKYLMIQLSVTFWDVLMLGICVFNCKKCHKLVRPQFKSLLSWALLNSDKNSFLLFALEKWIKLLKENWIYETGRALWLLAKLVKSVKRVCRH